MPIQCASVSEINNKNNRYRILVADKF